MRPVFKSTPLSVGMMMLSLLSLRVPGTRQRLDEREGKAKDEGEGEGEGTGHCTDLPLSTQCRCLETSHSSLTLGLAVACSGILSVKSDWIHIRSMSTFGSKKKFMGSGWRKSGGG